MSKPDECPAHSEDWLYKAVRGNRRNLGMEPQDCTCDPDSETTICARFFGGRHWFGEEGCRRCGMPAPDEGRSIQSAPPPPDLRAGIVGMRVAGSSSSANEEATHG